MLAVRVQGSAGTFPRGCPPLPARVGPCTAQHCCGFSAPLPVMFGSFPSRSSYELAGDGCLQVSLAGFPQAGSIVIPLEESSEVDVAHHPSTEPSSQSVSSPIRVPPPPPAFLSGATKMFPGLGRVNRGCVTRLPRHGAGNKTQIRPFLCGVEGAGGTLICRCCVSHTAAALC